MEPKSIPPEFWIERLALSPHPEGGFYRETYRASENIQVCGLPLRFTSPRSFSTAIYFLLRSQDKSCFHRIKSDELWHFHYGGTLSIYVLRTGGVTVHKLGSNLDDGETFQVVVPANCWFGARVTSPASYVLSSCTVAPGFDFKDFEMGERKKLITEFSEHREIIGQLTP